MTTVADLPTLPALVVGTVSHTRHRPIQHSFANQHYQWLVDLDAKKLARREISIDFFGHGVSPNPAAPSTAQSGRVGISAMPNKP